MTALFNLTLSPFAALFRISYAHPVIAILVSAAAGVLAYLTGHDNWMAVLVSFSAYLLIWMDERDARAEAPAQTLVNED